MKERKGVKPVVKSPRPNNFIEHSMTSGPYLVTSYMNNKGGFTIIAFKDNVVLEKRRVFKVSEVIKVYHEMCAKHIPNAVSKKGIEQEKKLSGPDEEGCKGGHCPVR